MQKSNIIKASRIWIYWKLANIPFYLGKWYIIFLITLWTEKHHRLNPGKTVVTCLEIFPGSAVFHGKHVSIKNKHFQNSCKFAENFFSLDGYRYPDPQLFISLPKFPGKLILMLVKTLFFPCQLFFFIYFRKKPTEIALRIERTLNNLTVMCRLIMLKRKEK